MKKNTLFKLILALFFIILIGAISWLSPLIAEYKNKSSNGKDTHMVDPTKEYSPSFASRKEPPATRFQDKVVFITGGTSGIGLATAVKFAAEGASHIIVCGRNKSKWASAQEYIKSHLTEEQRKKIEYRPCDVRVESDVKSVIDHIFKQYGRLDICFNNAGVQPGDASVGGDITKSTFESRIEEDGSILYRLPPPQPISPCLKTESCKVCDPSETTKVSPYCENPIATGIMGMFYSLKWEIAYAFEKQPKNLPMAIINTSSRNGIIPDPHRPLYAASKAFIISLTKSLSNQVAQRAIKEKREFVRINAISPGPVDTPLERAAFPGSEAEFVAKATVGVPMERVAQPEEIASLVLFLANENESSYITGADIPIDGGDVASPLMRAPQGPF